MDRGEEEEEERGVLIYIGERAGKAAYGCQRSLVRGGGALWEREWESACIRREEWD